MADQLPGVLERCLLSGISKEEAEFYDSFNGASPRQLDEGVTHLETPKSDTIEGQVLISVDETVADNDVLVLDPDSSTDGVLDYNLALTAAVVSRQEHTESHDGRLVPAVDGIDNVLAEANLHCDEQYVNAITTCCLHTLRGFFCLKPGKCPGQGHLCKEYQNGVCPFTGFEHDSAFHIVRSCTTACDEGQCFNADCKYGHDNLGTRRERWQQAKCEAEIGKAANKALVEEAVFKQLGAMNRANRTNATVHDRSIANEAAKKLRTKLKSVNGGEQLLQGDLRDKVVKALKSGGVIDPTQTMWRTTAQPMSYAAIASQSPLESQTKFNQYKELTTPPISPIHVGQTMDRDNIDNTTCEMLEVLERAMGRNGTALDRLNAKKTATSLVKRMKAKMGNGENIIRSSLKREAQKTINRYSDWVQRSS
ncbi:hypothetical protein Vi05172_g6855 [Venturia inaequalis]|nr:hypothetical protein Vi05172_g6855 [Venturia inaequalis]